MRNRKERQNSDRPGGRRGGGSKKSGPGPAPIHQHPPATPKIERVGEMRRRPGHGGSEVSSNVHPIWAGGP